MSKCVLVIMDGFGIAHEGGGNAISLAKKPNLDRIFAENAYTQLSASGLDVGLPEGQMGNSEVGTRTSAQAASCFRICRA